MKNVLLVAFATIAMLFTTQVKISAQVELGVKGGFIIANTPPEGVFYGGYYNIDLFLDIPLKRLMPNLYLQPGLSYSGWQGNVFASDILLLMSYRHPLSDKLKVYADFGPYFTYLGDMDAGLVFGSGVKFKRFSLGLQYNLGFMNIPYYDDGDNGFGEYDYYRRTLSLNVAYTIPNNFFRSIGKAISNIDTDALYNLGSALNTIGSSMSAEGGNTDYSGSYSSGSSSEGGSSDCASFQRRYNELKAKRDKEAKSNAGREGTADGKNAVHRVKNAGGDPDLTGGATSGDYRVINESKKLIREYERQMEKIARDAKKAGCSVY